MPGPASSAFRSCFAGCALVGGAAVALVALLALQRLAPPAPREVRPRPPRATPAPPSPRPRRPPPLPFPGPGPEPAPEPSPSPEASPAPGLAPGSFERKEDPRDYTLTWGFADHDGEPREVRCRIARDDHEREVSGFGYDEQATRAARTARLRAWAERALRERGLEGVVTLEVDESGWQARHQVPPNTEPGEAARLDVEARRFYRFLKPRFPAEWDAVTDALVRERGLRFEGHRLQIDYDGLAARASGPARRLPPRPALGGGAGWRPAAARDLPRLPAGDSLRAAPGPGDRSEDLRPLRSHRGPRRQPRRLRLEGVDLRRPVATHRRAGRPRARARPHAPRGGRPPRPGRALRAPGQPLLRPVRGGRARQETPRLDARTEGSFEYVLLEPGAS